MGVLSNNYAQIVPGALISASYVSDIYDVLMGAESENIMLSGSLNVTGSIYGNLIGTASYAENINLTPVINLSSSIAAEFDGLAEADEQTIELDTISNTLRLKSAVAAPSSSNRNFLGNIGIELSLSVSGSVFINTASLPETDPVVNGQLWRSGSFLMISTGSGV